MKLIFDQNISFRIVKKIHHVFPEASDLRHLGLYDASDTEIWEYARQHQYAIVTFDSDFIDLTNLKGFPPKIIWLRIGNTATQQIAQMLIDNKERIVKFLDDKEVAFFEIA
jgi:predicted nuclease of predicted toxin-antitoxin system